MTTLNTTTHNVVKQASEAQDAGNEQWWRPLEAAFTALGSVSGSILDIIQDEQTAGRPARFDITSLLTGIIPNLLTMPRKFSPSLDVRQALTRPPQSIHSCKGELLCSLANFLVSCHMIWRDNTWTPLFKYLKHKKSRYQSRFRRYELPKSEKLRRINVFGF